MFGAEAFQNVRVSVASEANRAEPRYAITSALTLPGSVRVAPISDRGISPAANAISCAAMNSGDHGSPGKGTFF